MLVPVIFGRQRTETPMGMAADFCPVCRKIAPFAVNRVGMVVHVYFIPASEGDFRGYSQTCDSCGTPFRSDPGRFICLLKQADMPIEQLIQKTFPSIREQYSERIELEKRIASGQQFDGEERLKILMEPFQIASAFFNERDDDTGLRVLANALRPLRPSEVEVLECLGHFRSKGVRIGLRLPSDRVMKALREKPKHHDFDY